jgi:hypothetical protein
MWSNTVCDGESILAPVPVTSGKRGLFQDVAFPGTGDMAFMSFQCTARSRAVWDYDPPHGGAEHSEAQMEDTNRDQVSLGPMYAQAAGYSGEVEMRNLTVDGVGEV